MPPNLHAQSAKRANTSQTPTVDLSAVEDFISTLEPGYFRHQEVGSDPQAKLDAVFFDAACLVDYERIDRALDLGANVNVVHPGLGATALHIAVGRQNRELIEHLLKRGGRLDVEDKDNLTPLDDAWRRARLEIDTHFAEWAERAWRSANPKAKGQLSMRLGL